MNPAQLRTRKPKQKTWLEATASVTARIVGAGSRGSRRGPCHAVGVASRSDRTSPGTSATTTSTVRFPAGLSTAVAIGRPGRMRRSAGRRKGRLHGPRIAPGNGDRAARAG